MNIYKNDVKQTPLFGVHIEYKGKMVPFAGYSLPVQYTGVIAEHKAVRTAAGMFDVSHMGEIMFSGVDALPNLQKIFTNDFSGIPDGKIRYSLMCNDDGGVIDDVLVYKYSPEKYLVVVNASNREKDFAWIKSRLSGDAVAEDISDGIAQIALQGPNSRDILLKLTQKGMIPEKYYTFRDEVEVGGVKCMVSQTGYTGELGYELYADAPMAVALWRALYDAGREYGLVPAGLGARDTLRLEAGMPLYGHEMDETVTPFEADLGFGVNMSKGDFIGKAALERRGDPNRIRVGLRVTGRGIARENETVYMGGEEIGRTTSGTLCPYIDYPAAMASLDAERSAAGTKVEIDIRGRLVTAEVVPLPFYSRKK
ncbi:MAG: glycine cleavage system aminomethyltransferase GcvT [Synergistaceae bacterium]|jgi:aminomethyltransferase|nr:glycine cleavage system aminomethyltransferase GcvT [Synergistaceae bacterium]